MSLPPYGKGIAFAMAVLGHPIKQLPVDIFNEVAKKEKQARKENLELSII